MQTTTSSLLLPTRRSSMVPLSDSITITTKHVHPFNNNTSNGIAFRQLPILIPSDLFHQPSISSVPNTAHLLQHAYKHYDNSIQTKIHKSDIKDAARRASINVLILQTLTKQLHNNHHLRRHSLPAKLSSTSNYTVIQSIEPNSSRKHFTLHPNKNKPNNNERRGKMTGLHNNYDVHSRGSLAAAIFKDSNANKNILTIHNATENGKSLLIIYNIIVIHPSRSGISLVPPN